MTITISREDFTDGSVVHRVPMPKTAVQKAKLILADCAARPDKSSR
jgi:hypothetical protein